MGFVCISSCTVKKSVDFTIKYWQPAASQYAVILRASACITFLEIKKW